MNFRLIRSILAAGCVIVAFSGCLYRMDIPQGNRIGSEKLDQLEIGMTRNQVKFLLGSPAVVDTYRPNQWHYVYFNKDGSSQKIEKKRMTLHFKDDLLFGIDGSVTPPS
jgi:outer membrane protein assembly factor BamE